MSSVSIGCVVGAFALGLSQGCAIRTTSPEAIAARTGTVLELVLVAQRAIIVANEADLIDDASTRTALLRIAEGARHALVLRPILEGWDQLSELEQADRLEQARAVVFTLSQVLAAITVDGDQMSPVRDALVAANGLLLAVDDLR